MMTRRRYPLGAILGDYARAALGLILDDNSIAAAAVRAAAPRGLALSEATVANWRLWE
jgi:hypothetical protein